MEENMGVETYKARFVTTHKVTIASVVGCITRSVNTLLITDLKRHIMHIASQYSISCEAAYTHKQTRAGTFNKRLMPEVIFFHEDGQVTTSYFC
jgi:hypothetical protein